MVISFKVKPMQYEGVCVVFLSASDAATGGEVQAPDGYDGNFDFWKAEDAPVRSYAFAFHTGFHQPYAFLRKNPGFVELAKATDVATGQVWYSVEIGREKTRLWMRIDGRTVLDAVDAEAEALPAGHVGLRLRGPGDGSFSCRYKDLKILAAD